jgi:hypothetical protein
MGSNITIFETLEYGRMIDSVISVDWIIALAWVLWFWMAWLLLAPYFLPSVVQI